MPRAGQSRSFDPVLFAIAALAAFLMFYNLGHRPLWQDEAETAALAVNALEQGVPTVFDGVNIISQEERREFNTDDYVWRWSPWIQIYMSAAGIALGGKNAFANRMLFALCGFFCVLLTYYLIQRHFGDRNWARLSALMLTLSVPFLLFARQGRYYSLGTLLVLCVLFAFLSNWQKRWFPVAIMAVALGLLFHANYLLLLSFAPPLLVAAMIVYWHDLNWKRILIVFLGASCLVIPGILLYRVGRQSGMFNVLLVPENAMLYFADLVMFMIPFPIAIALLWRWRKTLLLKLPTDPAERFTLFCALIILGNLIILAIFPQRFHRYLVHLYPLCAFILAWICTRLWSFERFSAVVLTVLLLFTNWVYLLPMEKLKIINRPWQNDMRMLTSVNFPLKLYLTELTCGYPDVNAQLAKFFNDNAKPWQTILAEYGDLPLQFYTPFRVIGGLQGAIPANESPDWVVRRRIVRVNRDRVLFGARAFSNTLDLAHDYELVKTAIADDEFGNRADPAYHVFLPLEDPMATIEIYRKKDEVNQ